MNEENIEQFVPKDATFVLKVMMKNEKAWKIIGTNKKKEKFETILKELKGRIAVARVDIMDPIDGKFSYHESITDL